MESIISNFYGRFLLDSILLGSNAARYALHCGSQVAKKRYIYSKRLAWHAKQGKEDFYPVSQAGRT
jgi:hypothetical protein